MAADGSLIFDARIDTQNFTDDTKNLKNTAAAACSAMDQAMVVNVTVDTSSISQDVNNLTNLIAQAIKQPTIEPEVDDDQFKDDMDDLQRQAGEASENVGKEITEKLSSAVALGNIKSQIVQAISSAVSEIPQLMVSVGASFESSMSQVAATMGITDTAEEFEMLSEAAKELGESTKYSASQAGESLNYLALAGMNAEEAVSALPTVLNVAAAGGMELAAASDLITDAMSALGLELSDMNTFADELAVTAQKSNTSVSQLGEAILTVGGTAKTLSGGVVEMNTALGILADNGIKGAEGGTALRNVILSLSAPTDKAAEALARLEVDAFDEAGKMRPLQDTIADLNEALSSMSDQEKTAVLNDIFNKVDLKAVNALLGTSAERFDELSGYISDCEGAAAQMAETMDDNLNGDLTIMQSALEGLGIAAYEKFQEPMRTAVQEVTNYIGDLSQSISGGKLGESLEQAAQGFSNLVSATSEFVADDLLPAAIDGMAWLAEHSESLLNTAIPLAAAIVTFNAAMKAYTMWQTAATAIQALKTAQEGATIAQLALNTAMEANPIGLVISLVAALTAGIIGLAATMDNANAKTEDYSRALDRARENGESIISSSNTEIALLQEKADRYEELRQKYDTLTSGEMAEFLDLADELQEVLPEGTSVLNEQTGAYNDLETAIDGVIKKMESQALLNAKYTEYETAIANRYDLENKIEQANKAWENDEDGQALIDEWRPIAAGTYGLTDSDADAKKAFMYEYFRDEYSMDFSQVDSILAENQAVIDEYNELSRQQYESVNGGHSYVDAMNEQNEAIGNYYRNLYGNASDGAEESAGDLKELWQKLDHEYSMGIIADDTELYRRRKELLEKYGDESSSEHWSYYEKLHDMEQDFADEQVKLAEDTAQKQKQSIQDEWDNIGRQRDNGFLTPEEAYKKQLEWIQKYCPEYSAEWDSYYQEVISYEENARKEQLNGVKESLTDTLNEYKKAYSELETSAKSYKNKLLSVGDLFAITTEKDENGNEKKIYSVENLREQMNEMRKYHNYVKDLINQGASQGLISELTSMDFDVSKIFAENLSKMSGAEFEQINSLYKERDKLADELANEIFEPQKEKLNKELAESILNELGVIPENIKVIGTEALEAFIEGISESGNLTEGTTKFIDDFFSACIEGLNASNINSALADELSTAFGEQDTYSMGKEKGEDFADGFNEALDQIYTQFDIERANVTASVTSSGQPVQPAAQSSGSLVGSSKNTEKIQINTTVELDGEKIGKASYEYSQNYSRRTDK